MGKKLEKIKLMKHRKQVKNLLRNNQPSSTQSAYIAERRIPKTWKEANMFLKGNRKDIKLFTQIITTRLEKKLDENQPRERAGFRSKYSTTDHIA